MVKAAQYEASELQDTFFRLSKKYCGYDTSTISFDTAERIMGAMKYCMAHADEGASNLPVPVKPLSADEAYKTGLTRVREKVGETLEFYNRLAGDFCDYDCVPLRECFSISLRRFFRHYDAEYKPHAEIESLEYRVLEDLSEFAGVDYIWEYLRCLSLEQKFLAQFDPVLVSQIISPDTDFGDLFFGNICEAVVSHLVACMLAEKPLGQVELTPDDYSRMAVHFEGKSLEETNQAIAAATLWLTAKFSDGDAELADYLRPAVSGAFRHLKTLYDMQKDFEEED